MPKTNDIPSSHEDMYKTALIVKNQLDSDKVILTSGVDWDSTIPFYTEKFAIMLPSWEKNDFTPTVKGEYFDPFEVLSNLEDYLGNRKLGAIVICNIRMSEDFEVVDITGAGDTVIALLTLGLSAGLTLIHSIKLANIAAGIVVGKVGTAFPTIEEISTELQYETSF